VASIVDEGGVLVEVWWVVGGVEWEFWVEWVLP
jgi:hypothetical protein